VGGGVCGPAWALDSVVREEEDPFLVSLVFGGNPLSKIE